MVTVTVAVHVQKNSGMSRMWLILSVFDFECNSESTMLTQNQQC
jgi:hypothetical protein